MAKLFSSLTFLAALGAVPVAIFAGTLADSAMPIRANSNKVTFYLSNGLAAAALGFQKDMHVPAVDIGLADVDPRLIKSADTAYALVDRANTIVMIQQMKDVIGRADKDTKLIDGEGYAIIMLDAETLKNEPQYAELIDREIADDSVLILVIGTDAEQTLRGLGIDQDTIVTGDDAYFVLETFAEFTLGLNPDTDGGDMPSAGTTSTLGAAAPELVDS